MQKLDSSILSFKLVVKAENYDLHKLTDHTKVTSGRPRQYRCTVRTIHLEYQLYVRFPSRYTLAEILQLTYRFREPVFLWIQHHHPQHSHKSTPRRGVCSGQQK